MARPAVYTWEASNPTFVAALQTTAGAGSLTLNHPIVSFGDVARSVTVSSGSNLSAISFTITGTYMGRPQSVTISGPNGVPTQNTAVFFDTVTDVSADAAVAQAVSIGSGTYGHTHWFLSNYQQISPLTAIQVYTVTAGSHKSYTYQSTLDDVQINPTPFITYGLLIPNPTNSGPAALLTMDNETNDTTSYQLYPTLYSCIEFSATTQGVSVTFLQQGIS